jgi:hypothetical protein
MRFLIACSLLLSLMSSVAGAHTFAQPVTARPAPTLDRDALRARLIEQRAANLARFRAYHLAGIYPNNTQRAGLLNVWRDDAGHFCAAATIIRASGAVALVDAVAAQNNFIRLADVTDGPVLDWMLTSGFTQDELVMIQKPFRPVTYDLGENPRPATIVADLRTAETARLAALYRKVEARLIRDQWASLERAVDRLMQRPDLVASLSR